MSLEDSGSHLATRTVSSLGRSCHCKGRKSRDTKRSSITCLGLLVQVGPETSPISICSLYSYGGSGLVTPKCASVVCELFELRVPLATDSGETAAPSPDYPEKLGLGSLPRMGDYQR